MQKILSKFSGFLFTFCKIKNKFLRNSGFIQGGCFFKNGCRFFVFSKWVILFFVCSFQYNNDSILFCFFEDCNTFSNYTLKFLFSLFCFCLLFKRFTVLQKSFFSSFLIYKIFVFFFVFTQFQHVSKKLF